jgi:hypothetical protein
VGHHVALPRTEGDAGDVVPLGKGIPGVQLQVRTPSGAPAGVGEAGEVWVRSPHLALGYLGDERLTAERFHATPGAPDAADRGYRTGDLGRYRPDGVVEPLGRADGQVKVRGFRVELGEIEAALRCHAAVRDVAVAAHGDAAARRLAAYVVASDGAASDAEPLRAHLRAHLPEFMVPAAFVFLPALPVTANGKVDRAALADPGVAEAAEAYVAPRTPTETALAGIWQEVLGQARVGAHDRFFDLGGQSLLATRVTARVRDAFAVELPLAAVFAQPRLCDLARHVEELVSRGDSAPRRAGIVPRRRAGTAAGAERDHSGAEG